MDTLIFLKAMFNALSIEQRKLIIAELIKNKQKPKDIMTALNLTNVQLKELGYNIDGSRVPGK